MPVDVSGLSVKSAIHKSIVGTEERKEIEKSGVWKRKRIRARAHTGVVFRVGYDHARFYPAAYKPTYVLTYVYCPERDTRVARSIVTTGASATMSRER